MIDLKRVPGETIAIDQSLMNNIKGIVVRMSVRPSATTQANIAASEPNAISTIPTDENGNLLSRHIFAIAIDITSAEIKGKTDQYLRCYPIAELDPNSTEITRVESRGPVARSIKGINRLIVYESLEEMPPEIMLLVTSELTSASKDSTIPAVSSGYLANGSS